MKEHPVFGMGFTIVNVAGNGDEEEANEEALRKVKKAIKDAGKNGYTITLSCGKLTTGVTIPEWNAVMMLAGSYSTSASTYLQTIFRVQSPCNKDGKMKTSCYVFDFAPDRTLKMVAEAVTISTRAGKTSETDRTSLGNFLNYCPVISIDGTEMKPYSTNKLLQQLKRAYAERVVRNGFDDVSMYNDELLKLDGLELKEFEDLKKIIGSSKSALKTNEIDINNQGFTDEEYEEVERSKNKPKKERTPEEQKIIDELNEKNKNRRNAISILRGISIRMPLLIYGVDVPFDEDITIDKFASLVDEQSWEEFMPEGVTKEIFNKFSKYYDTDIFVSAGRRIRNIAKASDQLEPLERTKKIAQLFSCFKNPDKETVLTPWRVVNMHMSDCIGGYKFYDDENKYPIEKPKEINQGKVTDDVLKNPNTKILEINSKTGLYPLFVAYSVYANKCKAYDKSELTFEKKQQIWDGTIKNNIFVICKTPMAKQITKRTLVGYRNKRVNAHYFEDLLNMLQNKPEQFKEKVLRKSYWEQEGSGQMKFDAIVGNPPYQLNDGGAFASAKPIYNLFVDASEKISGKYVSLIMPSRWMTGGKGLDNFRANMISDSRMEKLYDYYNSNECFTNVDIKGGICYFLWDKEHDDKCNIITKFEDGKIVKSFRFLKDSPNDEIFIRDSNLINIKNKVTGKSFSERVSTLRPYGLRGDIFTAGTEKYGLPELFDNKENNKYEIIGLDSKNKRTLKYAPDGYPFPKKDMLDKYKLFITRNYGKGGFGELPSGIIVAKPNDVCTESFVQIGSFDNQKSARNCEKYIKTKFFRTLVSIRKHDQGASRGVYEYVPDQDFSDRSDINWNDTIEDIDKQLYKKYNLTNDEIEYIEKNVRSTE